MIHYSLEIYTTIKENVRGGSGKIPFSYLLSPEEMGSRAEMLAVITLQPGNSIGEHAHVDNGELYYILTGSATVCEDGVPHVLTVGDVEFCADGHTHSISNHTDAPMSFLALIVPNR